MREAELAAAWRQRGSDIRLGGASGRVADRHISDDYGSRPGRQNQRRLRAGSAESVTAQVRIGTSEMATAQGRVDRISEGSGPGRRTSAAWRGLRMKSVEPACGARADQRLTNSGPAFDQVRVSGPDEVGGARLRGPRRLTSGGPAFGPAADRRLTSDRPTFDRRWTGV